MVEFDDKKFTLRAEGKILSVSAFGSDGGNGVVSAAGDGGIIVISAFPKVVLRTVLGRLKDQHPGLNIVSVGDEVEAVAKEAIIDVAGEYGLAADERS
ncbi:MAG: hypothetical protein ABIQ13_14085 [Pedococcus sp.]